MTDAKLAPVLRVQTQVKLRKTLTIAHTSFSNHRYKNYNIISPLQVLWISVYNQSLYMSHAQGNRIINMEPLKQLLFFINNRIL
jgi:hypothetical protein